MKIKNNTIIYEIADFVNVDRIWFLKTGRVFAYGKRNEYGDVIGKSRYFDEILDVCTGKHYVLNKTVCHIGNPHDVYWVGGGITRRARELGLTK